MRLLEWVQSNDKGELARLGRATAKSYPTICKLVHGQHRRAAFPTARLLAIATQGATSHIELCFSDDELAKLEAWELKRWREFALALERERAARARRAKRSGVAA